jgi:hypothetical protein
MGPPTNLHVDESQGVVQIRFMRPLPGNGRQPLAVGAIPTHCLDFSLLISRTFHKFFLLHVFEQPSSLAGCTLTSVIPTVPCDEQNQFGLTFPAKFAFVPTTASSIGSQPRSGVGPPKTSQGLAERSTKSH